MTAWISRIAKYFRSEAPQQVLYSNVIGLDENLPKTPKVAHISSCLCRQVDFESTQFQFWMSEIRESPRFHRKQWEFYFILQALHDQDFLIAGKRGLGFGVGQEPLSAYFAAKGLRIMATDQEPASAADGGWVTSDQHASGLELLNKRGICPPNTFRENVRFREADMNAIPPDFAESFDFCWSACCLEHLGSIEHGLVFIEKSIETLRPGGMAVHTTEFNLSSNDETFESPGLSLFRRRDIEKVIDRLQNAGHHVELMNWSAGDRPVDRIVDLPPYRSEPHLKLRISKFDCTSIGLIIRRSK